MVIMAAGARKQRGDQGNLVMFTVLFIGSSVSFFVKWICK